MVDHANFAAQLANIWKTIERWDEDHRNGIPISRLNSAARESDITDLTTKLGVQLPNEFLDSLRRHNGTADWTRSFNHGTLLSAMEILQELDETRAIFNDLREAEQKQFTGTTYLSLSSIGAVKPEFWSDKWIPFHITDWSKTCFDFNPAEGGSIAQIIEVNWEGGEVKVIFQSYIEFLQHCADHLPADPA